jgi:hypothetical protein
MSNASTDQQIRVLQNMMGGRVGRGGARWAQMGPPGQGQFGNPMTPQLNKFGVPVIPAIEGQRQAQIRNKENRADQRRRESLQSSLQGGIVSQMVAAYLKDNPKATYEELMNHVQGGP